MPELPEVEITARSLAQQLVGRAILCVERLDWERMVETPAIDTFRREIAGRRILAVRRRAKWLLIDLDAGLTLALHLRMSGRLEVHSPDDKARAHVHLILRLDDQRRLFFDDERKFGRVRLLDTAGLDALEAAYGPEPLDDRFTAAELERILRGRRTRIKPLLLDQRVIAGIGNIYASEALWLAGIHPLTPACAIEAEGVTALHAAIRQTLTSAIAHEGSSLRNYRNGYGLRGQNQEHFAAYDRDGHPCQRCGTPIERIVVGQRSTFFCPVCQPSPPT